MNEQQQIAALKNEIRNKQLLLKKLKNQINNKRFKPAHKSKFFYISVHNKICPATWYNNDGNKSLHKVFNCFKTKEEAQLEIDRVLLLRELRQFAKECNDGWVPDWNNKDKKYGIIFEKPMLSNMPAFKTDGFTDFNCFVSGICFKGIISAENALNKFKDRLHILVNN